MPNQPVLFDQSFQEVIVKYHGDIRPVAAALGVPAEELGDSFAILTIDPARVDELYSYKEIEYIELPKNLTLALQENLPAACISQVQYADGYHLTGKGVLVGIIDSGIDYTHPDFRNAAGNTRIIFLWDQTGTGTPPDGFLSGAEYTGNQINEALKAANPYAVVPQTDTVGHGTAVAGIAAGNGRASGGAEKGCAPEASLIVVKLGEKGRQAFARTTEIMRALKYVTDRASAMNMPVAINLSFGTNNGSHAGNSLFETYIDAVSQRFKNVVVAATGNEGSAGHHAGGKLEAGRTTDVEFVLQADVASFYVALWKSFSDTFELELIAPSGRSTAMLNHTVSYHRMLLDGADVVVYYGQPSFYNENQEIFIQFTRRQTPIPQGVWRIRIAARDVTEGTFHLWLPTVEEVGRETAFTKPDPALTLTLPSTAEKVISVGGYNALVGSAADFSGRGFTLFNVYPKPDVVAPATNVLSARSGGGYDSFTGTSMAAPFVTGAAALMMEWGIVQGNDPFLYGQRVKAFLQKSAVRQPELSYPNPIWGYGTLCLKAAMDLLSAYY